jgi:predicted transcriptional regulator
MKYLSMAKTEYIGIRTTSEIKKILQDLADKGYRSLSQQCEMAIIEWLKEHEYLKNQNKK